MFIGLWTGVINATNHKKWAPLNNQQCMTQPTLINLNPNEYSQGLHYYQFAVDLDKCVGICNILDELPNKVCAPKKPEELNLSFFNMIAGINEPKALTNHISWECKCKFDGRKCNSEQKWNNDKCQCECKNDDIN